MCSASEVRQRVRRTDGTVAGQQRSETQVSGPGPWEWENPAQGTLLHTGAEQGIVNLRIIVANS